MTRTNIAALAALGGFCAAATFILVRRYYGVLGSIDVVLSMPLWIIAVVCLFIAYMVKKRREEGKIGLDRTQLNPMMAANFMVFGKACAWAGAVCGGIFTGTFAYVAPRVDMLIAAESDLPGVISGALGAIALAVAGILLERACEVSPPQDGEPVQ
ncbi:DUF3180 domain-containing protein [Corynebacterium mayonis]|uniref:DUF3180 domain-containing protein n=1 Tax=Corynebacterium mayonis TaxID=3062461 RepID=UPI00314030E4